MDKSDKIFYGMLTLMIGFILMCMIYLTYVVINSEYIHKPNQILEVLNKENRIVSIKPILNYAKYITLENDIELKVESKEYHNIEIGDKVEVSVTEQVYNGEVLETTYEIIGAIE